MEWKIQVGFADKAKTSRQIIITQNRSTRLFVTKGMLLQRNPDPLCCYGSFYALLYIYHGLFACLLHGEHINMYAIVTKLRIQT